MSAIRETTTEERMTWGKCPVCFAEHGEYCHAEIGMQLGQKANGSRLKTGDGAHLARINNAPDHVQLVPVTISKP